MPLESFYQKHHQNITKLLNQTTTKHEKSIAIELISSIYTINPSRHIYHPHSLKNILISIGVIIINISYINTKYNKIYIQLSPFPIFYLTTHNQQLLPPSSPLTSSLLSIVIQSHQFFISQHLVQILYISIFCILFHALFFFNILTLKIHTQIYWLRLSSQHKDQSIHPDIFFLILLVWTQPISTLWIHPNQR